MKQFLLILMFLFLISCSDDDFLKESRDILGTLRAVETKLLEYSEIQIASFDPANYPIQRFQDSTIYRFNTGGIVDFSCCPSQKYSIDTDSLYFYPSDGFSVAFAFSLLTNDTGVDSLFLVDISKTSNTYRVFETVFFKVE